MRGLKTEKKTGARGWTQMRESIDEALVAILAVTVIGLLAAALSAAPA